MLFRTTLLLSTSWVLASAPALAQSGLSAPAMPSGEPGSGSGQQTIVVNGTREEATAIKENAVNVLDARSDQEIRSLPDVNAAEALQRIPGVEMESDSGEGRFVNIRGLDADLNAATYDGVQLTASNTASPQGGGRAIAFDAFPAGILGGLEVIKSLTPDMDATGLGGVVNILPRTIGANQHAFIDASAAAGWEPLRHTPRYQANATAGENFAVGDGGRLGVVFTYAYNEDQRGIDDVEADYINDPTTAPAGASPRLTAKMYDDVQPRYYTYHRIRQGYSGGLTYQPSDSTTFFIRGFHAGYTEYAHKHEFVVSGLSDDVIGYNNSTGDITADSANVREVAISTKEKVSNDLLEAGGSTEFGGGLKLDFRGAYTIGRDRFLYSNFYNFRDPATLTVTYNNFNPSVPRFHAADGTDLTDPGIYTSFSGNNRPNYASDKQWLGEANLSVPMHLIGSDDTLKFGGSARLRTRLAHSYGANFIAPGASYAAFSGPPEQTFYGGAYDIGPTPQYALLDRLPQTALSEDLGSYENDSENIYAGYAQYGGTIGNLTFLGGVRVEATRATYRVIDNSASSNYTNVFPDLNLRYKFNPHFQIHAAFSTAIGRPGFQQVTASRSIDLANGVVTTGNPALKPTIGRNIDLSAEYYTGHGGVASIGLFYKHFSDYIIPTVQRNQTYPGIPVPVELDSFQNIGSAHAYGLELDLRQQFMFLPTPLDGFGIDANLTLVDSRGGVHQDQTTLQIQEGTLPQTSPVAFNAALFYDKGPLQAKVAGSYVSRNLWAVGGSTATDVYSQPRFRLDASISYAVTPRMKFFFEAKNLTNTKLEFTQTESRDFPIQREFYKPDYLGGVRIKLGG